MGGNARAELTEQKLLQGWASGTAGMKVRLATEADLPDVARLVPAAGHALGEQLTQTVRDGVMGDGAR